MMGLVRWRMRFIDDENEHIENTICTSHYGKDRVILDDITGDNSDTLIIPSFITDIRIGFFLDKSYTKVVMVN